MIEPIDVKKVAETNPAVDVSKLEQADALRKQAEKIGVQIQTGMDYRIKRPFSKTLNQRDERNIKSMMRRGG